MNDDLSNIFEKLNINKDSISPEMINNVMNMINNKSSSENNQNNSTNSNATGSDIDINTILKLKAAFDKINTTNDPRANLLLSLKPYLKESRQSKLDQYIQMSKVLQLLPLISGDNNAKQ